MKNAPSLKLSVLPNRPKFILSCLLQPVIWLGMLCSPFVPKTEAVPVVIIKADDFRGPNQAWTNFLAVSRAAGIKVSIGVIAETISGNAGAANWMQAQVARGDVEFWDHGWDHKHWTNSGAAISEFGGSGLAHQREHLANAQAALKLALGTNVIAFGTPYNAFDTNTVTVVNGTPELRLVFVHNVKLVKKLLSHPVQVVEIIGESGGTGKPDAAKFEAAWSKRPATDAPVSLQFHPLAFKTEQLAEYSKIVNYLKAQNYAIRLPSDCVATKSLLPSGH